MKVQYMQSQEITKEIPDGYYKRENVFYKIESERFFKIDLGAENTWVDFSTYRPTQLYVDVEPITEQEWNEAVANLISTIYLSLPLTIQQEKERDDIQEQKREQELHNENLQKDEL